MNSLTVFIRRPVLATMLNVLLLVLGLFSYRTLGIDLMPKVEFPVVSVTTILIGASPEEIESQVTKPLEEAINTVAGIDELNSYSTEGISRIVVRFLLERPIAEAVQDVRDKVAGVVALLPDNVEPPVVSRIDTDSFPVVTLTVSGDRNIKELSEIARLKIKEAVENVDGVGSVTPIGQWKRAVNVILDLDKLEAYGIPISMVKTALISQNVEIPTGRVDRGESEQVLRTLARIDKVANFNLIVVTNINGRQITIGDIAKVEDSTEEPRSIARLWRIGDKGRGVPAISLVILKQSGTNTLDVINNVKKRIAQITPFLPKGIKIGVTADQSVFIKKSIEELRFHLILGGILASLAVLLFMRNIRSTLIAAVAIPSSLIATFALMKALNFTLNNMSLLGLTLAVGIVIDDAIVVLENIFRHIEEHGKTPFDAAIDGLKEIGLAVMATTTSLMVIFLPVAYMQGMIGRFFYEFGLTVAFAIGISLVVSFTLTPMLSSRFLKPKGDKVKTSKQNRFWGAIESSYDALLRWSLNNRMLTVIAALAIVASSIPMINIIGKDFLPTDDRSEFQVGLIIPPGSSLATADATFGKIEDEIHKIPGVTNTLMQLGSSTPGGDVTMGTIYVGILDLSKRNYSQFDVMNEVRKVFKKYPELRSSVNEFGGMSGSRSGYQFSYNLMGPDLDALVNYSEEIARKLRNIKGFVDVDTSLASRQPELKISFDRQKAADLGITASDMALSLSTMVGGEKVTKYREGVEQYDVWLRLNEKDRNDAEIISRLPIGSKTAGLVPLSQLTKQSEGRGPSEIDRFNRLRMVTIYANLDGIDLGSATKVIENIVKNEMKLPADYSSAYVGRAKYMGEAMFNMLFAFLLAFIFMYIVLAAQFESFLHPVTILLSLPLTLPFALLSLILLGETMNLYSILGVFMLFGIVKKNGILQIDYTNTLIARGKPLQDAILEANHARLRPILMTTLTLIAGMLPIAFGQGPGAASRASMAKVIIGGQALSLIITLIIVPVAYSLFEGAKKRLGVSH